MREIRLNSATRRMTLKKVDTAFNLQQVGRRGLKGDTGDQGPQGPQGIQGVKGDKGDQGDPGDPASNIITSVNGRTGAVTGLAEQSDVDTALDLKANTADLGTAAFEDTTAFATAAQGALADTATQPGDLEAVDTTALHKSGTETVTGAKTFTVSPIVPTPVYPSDAENKEHVKRETIYNSKEFIASTIITFIADDGPTADFTLLKPVFDSYGYKFTTAIITSKIDTAGSLTSAQIQQLYSEGHEIASHSVNHIYPGLSSLTEAEQLVEIRDSQIALNDLGVDCVNFVYPFGSANNITKELSRQYYRSGRRFHHVGLNPLPLHTFDLKTVSLGSWFDDATTTYPTTNTYTNYYKPWVDAAVASKQWLIFTLHSGATDGSFDATQQGYLVDTLNYIQSLGTPVKTLNEALDYFGNVVDVERYNTSGSTSSRFAVGADGSMISASDSSAVGRIGIGVEPSSPLHIASSNPATTTRDIFIDRYKSDDVAPYINTRKARGTLSAPAAIVANDNILGIFASGHDGSAFGSNAAALKFTAAENFTPTAQGTYMTLGTTPIGSTSRATRLKIGHDGEAIFTSASAIASGNGAAMSITPTVAQSGTAGHTTLSVKPTITSVGSGSNVLLDVGANAESYIISKYGAASSLTGGRGWLNIINPSSDAAGAGILFSSNTTPYVGLFQLDSTGNMVFRNRANAAANMYFDTNADVFFRTNTTSSTTILTIKAAGNVGIATVAPTHSLTFGSTSTGMSLYNTSDQTTNYERGRIYWTSNTLTISTENGGSGVTRDMAIGPFSTIRLNATDSTSSGYLALNRSMSTGSGRVIKTTGQVANSSGIAYALGLENTINQSGTAGYTMLLVNPTETTTGSGPKLLADFQVGGTSLVTISTVAATEGGRGFINVKNTSADASGSGFTFTSGSGGTKAALFQLDSTGQLVFRNSANAGANIYFDYNTNAIFRSGTGRTIKLTLDVDGGLTFVNGGNLILGTGAGTKIGTATTQKLAFWNATPIVQPTTAIAAAAFVANTSGTVDDSATYGGYTIGQVVAALKSAGLLA